MFTFEESSSGFRVLCRADRTEVAPVLRVLLRIVTESLACKARFPVPLRDDAGDFWRDPMLTFAREARENECGDWGGLGRGDADWGGECILTSERRGPMGRRATVDDILFGKH